MTDQWRLLADVGGTNVRFGRSSSAQVVCDTRSFPVSAFDSFDTAVRSFLATLAEGTRFSSATIAAAGPVLEDKIVLTNNDWIVSSADICRALGHDVPVTLLNDLEAVAHALPHLPEHQVDWIDTVRSRRTCIQRKLAINVGTGFGSATFIGTSEAGVSCPAESAHMHLGIWGDQERTLLSNLGKGVLTNEDVLSGDGVRRLWSALASARAGCAGAAAFAHDAFDFANLDPVSRETLQRFSTFLARASSDLVLATAAWDGVYFCGSVATAWFHNADHAAFRNAFVGTGKMRHLLAQTPIGLICHEFPAFVGLSEIDAPTQ